VGVSGADEDPCPSDAALGRLDYGKVLFSRTSLAASRDTLRRQGARSALSRDGTWTFLRYDHQVRNDDDVATNFAVAVRDELCPSAGEPAAALDWRRIEKRRIPAARGAGLRNLIRLARANGVDLILLFYPTHVLLNEIRRACQGAEAHWNWLWQIVSIVNEEAGGDADAIQVRDYSGYGPLNGERIHANKPMFERSWQDAIHFNVEVGAAVFDRIYSQEGGDFGSRATVLNFDELIVTSEERRRAFLESNRWVPAEVAELARRVPSLPPVDSARRARLAAPIETIPPQPR
jgi:hypothetical protein